MKLRFGIIGPGRIAERFARVAGTSECAEVVAVASRERSRAEAFALRMGVPKVHDSYLDLVRDTGIDAVYIGLTHNFHYEAAQLCLENGKAVLCEKPMATTKREAESLAALAASRNVLLVEAMWTRCLPAFLRAKEWTRAGKVGKIGLVEAAFCFKAPYDPLGRLFNPELAGGALLDAGVYPIEFAMGILGEAPSAIAGVASMGETGVDYFDSMSLLFPSGAIASLSCGLSARASTDARVYGDRGSIVSYNFLGSKRCELFDSDCALVETFEGDFEDGFIFEIEHFADLYRNGKKESDLIPLEDTIACAGIFDEMRKQWRS